MGKDLWKCVCRYDGFVCFEVVVSLWFVIVCVWLSLKEKVEV